MEEQTCRDTSLPPILCLSAHLSAAQACPRQDYRPWLPPAALLQECKSFTPPLLDTSLPSLSHLHTLHTSYLDRDGRLRVKFILHLFEGPLRPLACQVPFSCSSQVIDVYFIEQTCRKQGVNLMDSTKQWFHSFLIQLQILDIFSMSSI